MYAAFPCKSIKLVQPAPLYFEAVFRIEQWLNPLSTDGHYSGHLAKLMYLHNVIGKFNSCTFTFLEFTALVVLIFEPIRCFLDYVFVNI